MAGLRAIGLPSELLKLTPAERLQLAEDLWDSVAAKPGHVQPLTDAQRAEIERGLEGSSPPSVVRGNLG